MSTHFAKQFYDHSSYSNIYYAVQILFEKYFGNNIFRGDISRIVYASDDYSFRQRSEDVDKDGGFHQEDEYMRDLDLPFMNYWYTNYWTADDRTAALQSPQVINGTDEGTSHSLRAIAVKSNMTATMYFDRDDDARLAYEMILWEQLPTKIYLSTVVMWKNQLIGIPVNVDIDTVDFNPEFSESDWLDAKRITTVKYNLTVRSYIIGIPFQAPLPGKSPSTQVDNGPVYITERVLLDFFAGKNLDVDEENIELIVQEYFNPTYAITVNGTNADNITFNGARINWDVTEDEPDSLSYVKIRISGQETVQLEPPFTGFYDLTQLNENTEYTVDLLFQVKSGEIKTERIVFSTLNNSATPEPDLGNLKGMTF
jgi:hypothetical protein